VTADDAPVLHEGPLRVLALVTDAFGGRGGIAQFNRFLLQALSRHPAVALRAMALTGDDRAAHPSEMTWSVPRNGKKVSFSGAAAAAAIRNPPHVLISGIVGFGPLAGALAAVSRARLVSIVHGVEAWTPGNAIDAFALRRSALVLAVSRITIDRLRSWSRIPEERFELLPNATDLSRFSPGPRPRELAGELRIGDADSVLLTVGRLSSAEGYKGHDRVIRVLSRVAESRPNVRYVISGDGDDRPRLEMLARSCGVADRVIFLGHVPDTMIPDLYRLADVFVMPSTGEGFGIVFLEAMASGCPVIAGNRDGSVEAVSGAERGWMIDPDSPEQLCGAIIAALEAGRFQDRAVGGVEAFSYERFQERVHWIVDNRLGR